MQEDILPQRRLVGRTIALYNPAKNRWLGVNNEGGAASPAQGDAFHPGWKWERFEVHDVGNDQVGLRNPETRRWLRVMDDRVESFAMGDWNDSWGAERLQLRDAGDGHVGVYNPGSQRWVAVTPEGGTTAVRQGAGDVPRDSSNWERFRVELVDILPQRRLAVPEPAVVWIPGKFGDKHCRYGNKCEDKGCSFAHPTTWQHVQRPKPPSATSEKRTIYVAIDGMNVGRNRSTFDPEYVDETNPKRKAFDEVRAHAKETSPPLLALGVIAAIKTVLGANESKEARAAGVEYVPMAFLVEWVRDGGRSGALKAFNAELLDAWLSYITFTPSRRNDDDALIDFAKGKLGHGHECYLVTNDNFKDHINQGKKGKITDEWFKQHVVGYMWLGRDGELQLMPDPDLKGVLPGLRCAN
jgi:hypothetical protein